MSIIDNALKANREYAKRHDPKLARRPESTTSTWFAGQTRLVDAISAIGALQ
jgi:hypothetical protein